MNILFVVDSFFPSGTSISGRVVAFCKLFTDMGYNVHVIAQFTEDEYQKGETKEYFNNCTYQIVNSRNMSFISYFFPDKKFIECVLNHIRFNKCDVVVSLSCALYFHKIRNETAKKKIAYYVEQCEWQDLSNYKLGKIDPRYLRIDGLRKNGYKSADGIVSISKMLDDYYSGLGIKSVRIPTILDVVNTKVKTFLNHNDKINIVYTGKPGKSKEYLKPIIQCIASNDEIKHKFIFHIYGPSEREVISNIENEELLQRANGSVVVHGRLPQSRIIEILSNSHFQIFVRPNRRSSDAGFPTKLGESMAVGTPVITNNTGDICDYLSDGENGYILKGIESDNIKEVFDVIARLSSEQYKLLRINSRKTAEKNFDYRNYFEKIKYLFNINSCKESKSNGK